MLNQNKKTQQTDVETEPIPGLSLKNGEPLPEIGEDKKAFSRKIFPATKKELGRTVLGSLVQNGGLIANSKSEFIGLGLSKTPTDVLGPKNESVSSANDSEIDRKTGTEFILREPVINLPPPEFHPLTATTNLYNYKPTTTETTTATTPPEIPPTTVPNSKIGTGVTPPEAPNKGSI